MSANKKDYMKNRIVSGLSPRFWTISRDVQKFVGCIEKIKALNQSGVALSDEQQHTFDLYEATNGSKFRFVGCWYILEDSEKWGAWQSANEKKGSTPSKLKSSLLGSARGVSEISEHCSDDQTTIPTDLLTINKDQTHSTKRHKGVHRSKLDKPNLALLARQVAAAEEMAKLSKEQVNVGKEQVELNLFSIQADPEDATTREYLDLKRQQV
ncbi:hypothetical protein PI125_g4250 [Phytophthora idaei]|nr:hypothetical protein PI125_g4250 [Phytophthora idaei]